MIRSRGLPGRGILLLVLPSRCSRPPEASLVRDVERPFPDLDPRHLGQVRMRSRRIHVVRAGTVQPYAVNEDRQILLLVAADDDVAGAMVIPV